MKKLYFVITAFILLSLHSANGAINNDVIEKLNKNNSLIAENIIEMYQNYIIFSKKPVKRVFSNDKSIAHAYVMTTIDNVRDTIIVEAKSIGKTTLTAIVDNKEITINVTVQKNKTIVDCNCDLFKIISLDVPSEIKFTGGV